MSGLPQVEYSGVGIGGRGLPNVRPEVVAAFAEVKSAMAKSGLVKRAKTLDARRTKPYWSSSTELQARAFEAYVVDRLAQAGDSNDYLANIATEDYWKAQNALLEKEGIDDYPYPKAEEMPEICAAFDAFSPL